MLFFLSQSHNVYLEQVHINSQHIFCNFEEYEICQNIGMSKSVHKCVVYLTFNILILGLADPDFKLLFSCSASDLVKVIDCKDCSPLDIFTPR